MSRPARRNVLRAGTVAGKGQQLFQLIRGVRRHQAAVEVGQVAVEIRGRPGTGPGATASAAAQLRVRAGGSQSAEGKPGRPASEPLAAASCAQRDLDAAVAAHASAQAAVDDARATARTTAVGGHRYRSPAGRGCTPRCQGLARYRPIGLGGRYPVSHRWPDRPCGRGRGKSARWTGSIQSPGDGIAGRSDPAPFYGARVGLSALRRRGTDCSARQIEPHL